jgi:hypothetical protein
MMADPDAADNKRLLNALKMAEKHKAEEHNKVVPNITPPVN